MAMLKNLFFIIILFISSCGKVEKESTQYYLDKSNALLNYKDYEGAISLLEEAVNKHDNEELKLKLAHAYAGAAGFEAYRLYQIYKSSKEILSQDKINFYFKAQEILQQWPDLTSLQAKRLNQSIEMYHQIKHNDESNFKWSLLKTFRAMFFAKELNQILNSKKIVDNLILVLQNFHQFLDDLYQAYFLFKHSYENAQKISYKWELSLAAKYNGENCSFKIVTNAPTLNLFLLDLWNNNINYFNKMLNSILVMALNSQKENKVPDFHNAFKMFFDSCPSDQTIEEMNQFWPKMAQSLNHAFLNDDLQDLPTPEEMNAGDLLLIKIKEALRSYILNGTPHQLIKNLDLKDKNVIELFK